MSTPDTEREKATHLAEFILKLQEDSELLAEFDLDPDKVMIESGIASEEDRNIVKTRDMLKIRQLLEKEKKYTLMSH